MSQTITLTQSTTTLGLSPAWRATPLVLTGTVDDPVLSTWKAQLWRRPQDINDDDAEPLAIAIGSVTGSTVRLAFTAAQMDISLVAGGGMYDDLWLVVGGTQSDSQGATVVGDWLRIKEGGFDVAAVPETTTTFTVVDDVVTFEYDGQVYSHPVSPVATPLGATEGGIIVVDDVMIYTIGGASYSTAVVPIDEVPPASNTENVVDFIVGTDGATYQRTTTPGGETYYQPVFTTAP